MERSRSKRYYHDQDYESENLHSRSKPRYGSNSQGGGGGGHNYNAGYHRRSSAGVGVGGGGGSGGGGGGGSGNGRKTQDSLLMVTTSYRILCHDVKVGGVIGKSGSIIKSIRQHTGAWINVHELVPGDEERIIEISDTRRRDPDGRIPSFSPAQEALFLIHDRILESEVGGYGHIEENEDYGGQASGAGNRVVTRLLVSRMHVGCLLGKGGKIIEQMRMETNTHIRVLPRDHTLPRCVAMSEEIVQVVGDVGSVQAAVAIISSRLRESQHRDRSHAHNRMHSPEPFFPGDDDFRLNSTPRRSSLERRNFGSKNSVGSKSNNHGSHSSGFAFECEPALVADNAPIFSGEDLVFRILCPADRVDRVVGESNGILDLLQNEIGINIEVSDQVTGTQENIIIISSDEGPDDELFPSQEALLHIQTRIVDIVPEKDTIATTRLLLRSDEINSLHDIRKIGGADIEILPREKLPDSISGTDEIVQIIGEIKSAREALLEVTSRVRSYIYRDFFERATPLSKVSASSPANAAFELEAASSNSATPSLETQVANGSIVSASQSSWTAPSTQKVKDGSLSNVEKVKQNESEAREDQPSGFNRIAVPLVTKSTLEIVIPPQAAAELAKKSKMLTLFSEISGATVKLIDDSTEKKEKIIQISGTPEQADRAQSLLQGFILSTDEDGA